MARQTEDDEMTDEEVIRRLRDPVEDERTSRLVRCENEDDLKAFFASLRSDPV